MGDSETSVCSGVNSRRSRTPLGCIDCRQDVCMDRSCEDEDTDLGPRPGTARGDRRVSGVGGLERRGRSRRQRRGDWLTHRSSPPPVQTVARVVPANSISPASASASERLPPPPPSPSAVVCLPAMAWSVHAAWPRARAIDLQQQPDKVRWGLGGKRGADML